MLEFDAIVSVVLTRHARDAAARRHIDEAIIRQVAAQPGQCLPGPAGCVVLQGKFFDSARGKTMLLRIIARETPEEIRVLTVYKTSRIDKYWKAEGEKL